MNKEYLEETKILNYNAPSIQAFVLKNKWAEPDNFHKIKAIYEFVQNDILFGYNSSDTLNAVQVFNDGIGQCNTKATLLMALLRAVNIPCRLHAFNVIKDFQKGATSNFISLAECIFSNPCTANVKDKIFYVFPSRQKDNDKKCK